MKTTGIILRLFSRRKCMLNQYLAGIMGICLFCTIFSPVAFGTDYYVSPAGNDNNSGTLEKPLKTISKGVTKLKAGDVLYVRTGTYVERIYVDQSGTADAPVTIMAYPGEYPVIDGENTMPSSQWSSLVTLTGDYVAFIGFEVKNSNGMAVILEGQHDRASKIIAHHAQENGVLVCGDYGIAEDCVVWQCDRSNSANPGSIGHGWSTGISAARSPVDGITTNAILRRNIAYNNWGEGISSFEAEGTLIEDNITYDNWSVNLYVSDTRNALVQRNIVYNTPNNIVGERRPLTLGDERSDKPRSANNTVINNFIYNADLWAFWSTGVPGSGLDNVLIANNTIVNGQLQVGASIDDAAYNTSGTICNNIFVNDNENPWEIMGSLDRLIFSHNLWSKTPPSGLSGTGDVIGDPGLAKTGETGPGKLSGNYFKLQENSPAINKGIVFDAVKVDFFMTPRDANPDLGGYEYIVSTGVDDIPASDSNDSDNNGSDTETPDTTNHSGSDNHADTTIVVINSVISLHPSHNETLNRLILYNMSGVCTIDRNLIGGTDIDVSYLPSGIYILVLTGKTYSRKITQHKKLIVID
jgi:hypothetical protein